MIFPVFVLFFVNSINCFENLSNPWVWLCNPKGNKCQRELKIQISNQTTFNSLELCRLMCGKYAGLWPKPTYSTKLSKNLVQIHPNNIKFTNPDLSEDANTLLKEMQNIFMQNSNLKCTNCDNTENIIKINLDFNKTNSTNLNSKTNEKYQLRIFTDIPTVYINISAENIFGIRHGLETLSQLIAVNNTMLCMVSQVLIKDGPKFHHRGLLIDTARHYLKLSTIKKQIDGLGMNKMNVLHWHVTDSHSFPFSLPNVPQLAQYGAYSEEQIYSLKDIEEIIRYSKIRGVRVILEIDTPSHTGNGWQFGELENETNLGELATCLNYFPHYMYCLQPPCGQINPINDNVYVILEKLFKDIGKVYVDQEYFHLGGDEVSVSCWQTNKDIVNYVKSLNDSDIKMGYLTLWAKYQNKILNIYNKTIANGNQKVIIWSSGLTNYKTANKFLDKNKYIIQTWVPKDSKLPKYLLKTGFEIIMSPKNSWYLDHGVRSNTKYSTWRQIFANKLPIHKNVLGGEVCLWGEYVDDINIETKIWPRAAAVAERLWTNSKRDHSKDVENRFYLHRERLVANQIRAEPVAPQWCVQNEGKC